MCVDHILSWLGTPPGFRVVLWWRDDPRIANAAKRLPTRHAVNGGFARPGTPEVFVYRAEEYERVLIHEVIHAMRWDWTMPEKPLPCWNFSDRDILTPWFFEAWTELYAEWLYCGYFNIPWDDQRDWQEYQALQILARASSTWKEDTNVFAYYVLKAALAPHIEFLWVAGNGKTPEERMHILCALATPELERLRTAASRTRIEPMSLRMTQVKK